MRGRATARAAIACEDAFFAHTAVIGAIDVGQRHADRRNGAIVFALALALVAWAITTMTRAGSNVPTRLPTTTIVETGPYRFTRNPIYLGMMLGLIGLAIAINSLWLLMTLVPFALVIRYGGVITREEAYLERKFGDVYRRCRARVRRWL
ncbi:isoprenylcysteine carboxylmethyltransferase family protein [Bradyrhizobium sp. Ash2021]|uniref:methyltransferase family protein n=1 Tax=Bradyrhizobium sp. Ash2021 TaxID=2954771 RepID=UPI0028152F98|nr:isoprenylcysteine carboxylmethyltransferase family protein [Bradyrhizobium sp. Ash2021]WMT74841.1 isoprenylcysteine carboxylmethyltransferase family protein [Bradyrhizobium sp. Ash2021]